VLQQGWVQLQQLLAVSEAFAGATAAAAIKTTTTAAATTTAVRAA
jgi:hypothetical protein